MNDPEGLLEEAKRAVTKLNAVGVQIFSNVLGRPLDKPETMPVFDLMVDLDRPLWLHPARGADFPDYRSEAKSHYEIWWTLGWPYETSVAMAHLVFAGLFDRLPTVKIITHHLGGMIPYFEGRVGPGWDQLGSRTSDVDYTVLLKQLKKDLSITSTCSTRILPCSVRRQLPPAGLKFFGADHLLFGSDSPFDPEKGFAYIRWTIKIIDELPITRDERYAIYEGNARRLLKLE